MNSYLIPLNNAPQRFTINLAGTNYTLSIFWNDLLNPGWMLDIADSEGNPIVCGLPLVTGRSLLDGLDYLNFGCQLYVYTDGDQYAVPTFDNLGDTSNLYMVVSS